VSRYVETFFRHKLLLTAPVVIALVLSVWYATSQKPSYTTTTSIWIDTPLPGQSSLDGYNGPSPAAQAQSLLQELVATRDFDVKAGHRGPLPSYLAAHPAAPSKLSKLLSFIKKSSSAQAPLDDRLVGALNGAVGSSVAGPQVLKVSLTGADPAVLPGTLEAVVAEYSDEINALRDDRNRASLDYLQQRLDAATTVLTKARSDELQYLTEHPTSALTTVVDPAFSALAETVSSATDAYNSAKGSYDQLSQARTAIGAASAFHVIDQPEGAFPVSHSKRKIFAGVAGLLFGVVISALAITALTAADKAARHPEDIAGVDGGALEVVASIERFRDTQPTRAGVS
jgi:uncharacterized protein involved in exopolysaccharide biosynthesis